MKTAAQSPRATAASRDLLRAMAAPRIIAEGHHMDGTESTTLTTESDSTPSSSTGHVQEIVNPATGEIVDQTDADSLIDAFEQAKAMHDRAGLFKYQVQVAIAALATEGETKTRRVRGKRRLAKVTMPDLKFEQSILKELLNSYPEHSKEYLRIESVGVRLTEYKKLSGMKCTDPAFTNFKQTLIGAERPPTSTPSVSIEE